MAAARRPAALRRPAPRRTASLRGPAALSRRPALPGCPAALPRRPVPPGCPAALPPCPAVRPGPAAVRGPDDSRAAKGAAGPHLVPGSPRGVPGRGGLAGVRAVFAQRADQLLPARSASGRRYGHAEPQRRVCGLLRGPGANSGQIPGFNVRIVPASASAQVGTLKSYSGSVTYTFGSRQGRAVLTFQVARAGRFIVFGWQNVAASQAHAAH